MKKSELIIILSLTALLMPVMAKAADLLTTVRQIADYDASLASARSAYEAMEQSAPLARSGLLPRVDAGWGRMHSKTKWDKEQNGVYDDLGESRVWQSGWKVALSQPLFDWELWANYKQSEIVVAKASVELAKAQQDLLLRASEAYFQALAAEEEVARTERFITTLKTHQRLVEKKQKAGEATLIDVSDAETSLEQAYLQNEAATEELRVKRLALEQLTGEPFTPLASLRNGAVLPELEPADEMIWVEQAKTRGYPVQLGELSRHIAELETEKARAGHYPVASLNASHMPIIQQGRAFTETQAMFQISVPLFTGWGASAKVSQSRALEQKARNDMTDAIRKSEALARESHLRINAGRDRIKRLTLLQHSARASFEATSIGYNVGSRLSTDVLRSVEILFSSESSLIRTRYELIIAVLNLKASAASLTLDDIEQINHLLTQN